LEWKLSLLQEKLYFSVPSTSRKCSASCETADCGSNLDCNWRW
jgi:hypothetical protein